MTKRKQKIGLALGSGSARGMSHIGIIQELQNIGIKPDIVAGCSIGALVGASYAAGNLDKLCDWANKIDENSMKSFYKLNFVSSGFISSDKFKELFEKIVGPLDLDFADLSIPFQTVATDLSTGGEVWIKKGNIYQAVTASMAMPGLFPAVLIDNRWLVDGGLVNPVPASLCYVMGADSVIAVNLNADLIQSFSTLSEKSNPNLDDNLGVWESIRTRLRDKFIDATKITPPKTFDMVVNSINIMQVHLTRSKLAGNPPNILLAPKLAHIGMLEFYSAKKAIKAGSECVKRMEQEIFYQLDLVKKQKTIE